MQKALPSGTSCMTHIICLSAEKKVIFIDGSSGGIGRWTGTQDRGVDEIRNMAVFESQTGGVISMIRDFLPHLRCACCNHSIKNFWRAKLVVFAMGSH